MKILITGGAGFIGSHLASHHLGKKDEVWVVDNLSTGRMGNLASVKDNPLFRFTKADLNMWDELDTAITWAEGVYHLAAIVGQRVVIYHPVSVLTENIRGCEKILKSITEYNKACRLVIASSSEVYGQEGTSSFREDAEIHFPSGKCVQVNYPLSKFVNETTVLSYTSEKGLDCVIARLFNTTGPNQTGRYGMVVPRFIDQALSNQPLTVFGDGNQTRSFCDIRDTIEMLDTLMHHPKAKGEIFNVGNDYEISILELASLVKKHANSTSEIVHISYEEAYGVAFQDTVRRCPDLTKVRKYFSFEPRWALENTIDDMLQKFNNEKAAHTL